MLTAKNRVNRAQTDFPLSYFPLQHCHTCFLLCLYQPRIPCYTGFVCISFLPPYSCIYGYLLRFFYFFVYFFTERHPEFRKDLLYSVWSCALICLSSSFFCCCHYLLHCYIYCALPSSLYFLFWWQSVTVWWQLARGPSLSSRPLGNQSSEPRSIPKDHIVDLLLTLLAAID